MTIRATFDEQGFVSGFYPEEVWPAGYPSDAVEITSDQYTELLAFPGARIWHNGTVIEYIPPTIDQIIIVPAVTLWERLSETEAELVDAAMKAQPFRTRQIFLTANSFRSDHELWPLLKQMATELFGEERTAELLAEAGGLSVLAPGE